MPKRNAKAEIIKNLVDSALSQISLIEDLYLVIKCRRGINYGVPKSIHWSDDILTSFDENRFRQMLRVDRRQFDVILSLIKDDKVFRTKGKQFPIDFQLAVVLYRLGSSGESASVAKIASTFGIGDGGTLFKITKRIFIAILKLMPKFICWPNASERSEIVQKTFNELPFCVGYVDGTEIKLAEAPIKNHEAYFSRTHIYSLKAQVICDNERRIRDVVVGYSGSTHDAKIFKNCSIYKHRDRYFSQNEWIAGDSAYPLSNIVITPYRRNSRQLTLEKRNQFNKRHGRYRVRVEHCFGILKGRFNSLKELRMRIHDEDSQKFCNEWILVCCVLHNILIENNVTDNDDDTVEDEDISDSNEPRETTFETKRQWLYNLLFPE